MLEFEGSKFEVRNTRIIPDSPEVGDKITLEVELSKRWNSWNRRFRDKVSH